VREVTAVRHSRSIAPPGPDAMIDVSRRSGAGAEVGVAEHLLVTASVPRSSPASGLASAMCQTTRGARKILHAGEVVR
jgi:hypothetical protein